MAKRHNEMVATIKSNLVSNPAWVERAILALYDRQTTDEQATEGTRYDNKMGFNSSDARRMSFVAKFLQSGGHLTREKALTVYGPRLQKYALQLALVAEAKAARKAVEAASPRIVPCVLPMPVTVHRSCGGCENCDGEDLCTVPCE